MFCKGCWYSVHIRLLLLLLTAEFLCLSCQCVVWRKLMVAIRSAVTSRQNQTEWIGRGCALRVTQPRSWLWVAVAISGDCGLQVKSVLMGHDGEKISVYTDWPLQHVVVSNSVLTNDFLGLQISTALSRHEKIAEQFKNAVDTVESYDTQEDEAMRRGRSGQHLTHCGDQRRWQVDSLTNHPSSPSSTWTALLSHCGAECPQENVPERNKIWLEDCRGIDKVYYCPICCWLNRMFYD